MPRTKPKEDSHVSVRWGAANIICFARWNKKTGRIDVKVDLAHTGMRCLPGSSGWERLEQRVPFIAEGAPGYKEAYKQFREFAYARVNSMIETD